MQKSVEKCSCIEFAPNYIILARKITLSVSLSISVSVAPEISEIYITHMENSYWLQYQTI